MLAFRYHINLIKSVYKDMSDIWHSAQKTIEKITKSSALSSLVTSFIVYCLFAGAILLFTNNTIVIIGIVFIAFIFVVAIVYCFIYLMKNNPSMLRSEMHVIQNQALAMLGDEQNKFDVSATDVVAIVNKDNPFLPTDIIPGDDKLLINGGEK